MFASIIKIVILPVILGMLVNRFFKKPFEPVIKAMPFISNGCNCNYYCRCGSQSIQEEFLKLPV